MPLSTVCNHDKSTADSASGRFARLVTYLNVCLKELVSNR